MKTVTVSARLEADEADLLAAMAHYEGCDRSTLIKTVLRRGMREIRMERACTAFRKEEITLSRAAELAGLGTWDFLALADQEKLNLHYDVDELEVDLKNLNLP
jgi:predicted HTH domain antitoxin